jgi:hypothetical protein
MPHTGVNVMAITTVQSSVKSLKTIRIKKHCLGPGGAPLFRGQVVRVPEADAYTLTSGGQADFLSDAEAAKAEK